MGGDGRHFQALAHRACHRLFREGALGTRETRSRARTASRHHNGYTAIGLFRAASYTSALIGGEPGVAAIPPVFSRIALSELNDGKLRAGRPIYLVNNYGAGFSLPPRAGAIGTGGYHIPPAGAADIAEA